MIATDEETIEILGEEEFKRLQAISKLTKNEREDRAKRTLELMKEPEVSEERLQQIYKAMSENCNQEEEYILEITKEEALAAGFEPETISQKEYEELQENIKNGKIKFVKV
ncbi:MAG: hypothetical protein PUB15_06720 [Ruminobacter sp.]|nr:hypothetical protein [Ruminobacter sp.]